MSDTFRSGIIPRGSLGLKLLLVLGLVLAMSIPLMLVGALVSERHARATVVTQEIGARAGGAQVLGGPVLLAPYERTESFTNSEGEARTRRVVRGAYMIFAETGSATTELTVEERRSGIYRAATYAADTEFSAVFKPREALADVGEDVRFDWADAQIVMFVGSSSAVREVSDVTFSDGTRAELQPMAGALPVAYAQSPPDYYSEQGGLQEFSAPVSFTEAPEEFSLTTGLVVGGAQSISVAAFAQNSEVKISGDRQDAKADGAFQTSDAMVFDEAGFDVAWRVPYVARGIEKALDTSVFNLSALASRSMRVSFVGSDDVYQGVARAVRYAIMFIGIVFLSTLIFEALSSKKAHPAQYLLVGLAQCVFYLLLLSITEMIGFTLAFAIAAGATVLLLAYYAGASSRSLMVGVGSFAGLSALYGVMYVLMTIEDFAFFAGSMVAFLVIAGAMISTSRINWYGRGVPPAADTGAQAPAQA